jgi:hypothetical protein
MSERPTPEERLQAWLAWQAVRDEVPFDQRVAYMDMLRETLLGKRMALGFEVQEAFRQIAESSRRGRFVVWLTGRFAKLTRGIKR